MSLLAYNSSVVFIVGSHLLAGVDPGCCDEAMYFFRMLFVWSLSFSCGDMNTL